VLARGLWQYILRVGVLIAAVTLLVQSVALRSLSAHWQTVAFTTLTFTQLAHALAVRRHALTFSRGFLANRWLIGAVLLMIALQLVIIYAPPAQSLFRTRPLDPIELLIVAAASLSIIVWVDAEKLLRRRRAHGV
jgi:Ca2+-transporting ATPase